MKWKQAFKDATAYAPMAMGFVQGIVITSIIIGIFHRQIIHSLGVGLLLILIDYCGRVLSIKKGGSIW